MTAEISNGVRSYVEWGWLLGAEFFLNAIAAGALGVSAMLVLRAPRRRGLALLAAALAVTVMGGASSLLLLDVGQPLRVWHLWVMPNWHSPLSWGTALLSGFLLLSTAHLGLVSLGRPAARWTAAVALPLAAATHGYTAFVLTMAPGRPLWNQPLLAPLFLLSSLCAGASVVLALAPAVPLLGRRLGLAPDEVVVDAGATRELRRLLTFGLVALLAVGLAWLGGLALGPAPARRALHVAWSFLPGKLGLLAMLLCGAVLPLVLLPALRRHRGWAVVALTLCVLLGALATRLVVVVGGQLVPMAGPLLAPAAAAPSGDGAEDDAGGSDAPHS